MFKKHTNFMIGPFLLTWSLMWALMAIFTLAQPALAACDTPTNIDDNGLVIRFKADGISPGVLTTLPATNKVHEGTLLYDNSSKTLKLCNGSTWLFVPAYPPIVNTAGTAQRICSGTSATGQWVDYTTLGIYLDVNTSSCNFTNPPAYFTMLDAAVASGQYDVVGVTSLYNVTATGFRVYLSWNYGASNYDGQGILRKEWANTKGWYIQWMGIGN